MDKMHTTIEAAQQLGLSRQQLSSLCKQKIIESIKIGGIYLLTTTAIEAYKHADSRKKAAKSGPGMSRALRNKKNKKREKMT